MVLWFLPRLMWKVRVGWSEWVFDRERVCVRQTITLLLQVKVCDSDDSTATIAMHLFIDFATSRQHPYSSRDKSHAEAAQSQTTEDWDTTGKAHNGSFNKLSVFCRNIMCVGSNTEEFSRIGCMFTAGHMNINTNTVQQTQEGSRALSNIIKQKIMKLFIPKWCIDFFFKSEMLQ